MKSEHLIHLGNQVGALTKFIYCLNKGCSYYNRGVLLHHVSCIWLPARFRVLLLYIFLKSDPDIGQTQCVHSGTCIEYHFKKSNRFYMTIRNNIDLYEE